MTQLNKFSSVLTQNLKSAPAKAMLYSLGLKSDDFHKPQVGIGAVHYESNPCNSKLNILSSVVKKSVSKENLLPWKFTTVGVSDGITMGTEGMRYSLPSRDLIADSFETITDAHYYDSFIGIPGCDKNLPAVAMAMFRLNRPSMLIYGGSMQPSLYNDRELDIVSSFEAYGQYIKNEIDLTEYNNIIENSCHGNCGSCSGLYTANTMASILEVMGLTLPNSSSNPSISLDKMDECDMAGKTIKNLIEIDLKPLDFVKKESFLNAIKMLYVTGGSTNGVIHLLAMARAANVDLTLDDFKKLEHLPVLLNMKPHGEYMMYHLHQKGGMSLFIKYLIECDIINGEMLTITGKSLIENLENVATHELSTIPGIICPIYNPFKNSSHIKIVKGNMAPDGAVLKTCEEHFVKSYSVKVYDSEQDMINDLEMGNINVDNFVIIRYQGETVGCPEMLSPTSALVGYFGDQVPPLATDGRFSGGSRGILICHLPDAYKPESITSIIENDDDIRLDTFNNTIQLSISPNEIEGRKTRLEKRKVIKLPNYVKKYSKLVGNINDGYST